MQLLARHPDSSCEAIERIEADLGENEHGAVRLRYRMIGDAQRVVTTPLALGAQPQRRDALWRHTCCELFVHDRAGSAYREYNFAPNGDWAAYRFADYRTGMESFETAPPRIVLDRSPAVLCLSVTLDDLLVDALHARRVGLACIVETASELSYWALAHPPGRPDFHHARSFALTVVSEQTTHIG